MGSGVIPFWRLRAFVLLLPPLHGHVDGCLLQHAATLVHTLRHTPTVLLLRLNPVHASASEAPQKQ